MLINHASHAFCNQPALGGPVYWIRNIAYNLPGGSTRLTGGSAGVIFYNNTILSETSGTPQNAHWRNNLIMGQNSGPTIFSVTTNTKYTHRRTTRVPAKPRSQGLVPVELTEVPDPDGPVRAWRRRFPARDAGVRVVG
jgi:hypothetical protein